MIWKILRCLFTRKVSPSAFDLWIVVRKNGSIEIHTAEVDRIKVESMEVDPYIKRRIQQIVCHIRKDGVYG